jgi:Cu(I)/Ag(I) efflux system membrane fusion protein
MATDSQAVPTPDESGGAPADVMPHTRRQKLRLVGLVILKRVRFLAILAGVGLFIGYWDTVMNYWEKWTRPASVASRQLEPDQEFYCPMDPQVIRSTYEPNGDVPKCPICGMPLSARKKGETAKLPEGITGRVQLTPERIQLAGIRTAAVRYRPVAKQTKTVGFVAFDESRLSKIVSRVSGYVEKLYVDKIFTTVRQGDPLAEIYSPDLYSTAQEMILRAKADPKSDLVASARKRLELWGVSAGEIDAILSSGQASPRLVIRSPRHGYVIGKTILVGSSVEPGMTLLEVADLSTVWVEAEVYEKDIPFLQVGQKVDATVEAYPQRTFTGKLALVYPELQTATRTNRVRIELGNPQQELRPGMFAAVRINTPLESIEPYKTAAVKSARIVMASQNKAQEPPAYEFLVVPERAVIDTGVKKVVYVEREPGLFEGIEVQLGPRQDDVYPVIKGLKPEDKIAVAGGFLIDAETRLNPAAAATYFGASGGPQSATRPSAPSGPSPRPGGQSPDDPSKPDQSPAGTPAPSKPEPKVALAVPTEEDLKNIQQLPEQDRKLALAQQVCPVTEAALGSMGVPTKIALRGQPVYFCCEGCEETAKRNPEEALKKVAEYKAAVQTGAPKPEPKVAIATPTADDLKNIQQLSDEDRKLALAQRVCPITNTALGSMGVPVKITLRGQPVLLCCKGCIGKAKRTPDETLQKAVQFTSMKSP